MEPIRGLIKINDPFYRYKMALLQTQKEKTSTVILNLDVVASDMNIDVNLIIQYIKNRLGILIKTQNKRLIIPNSVDIDKLKDTLYEFIEYFILCPNCRLPETDINTKNHVCRACGKTSEIIKNKYTNKILDKL